MKDNALILEGQSLSYRNPCPPPSLCLPNGGSLGRFPQTLILATQLLGCPFLRRLVLVVPLFWKASSSNPFPTLLTLRPATLLSRRKGLAFHPAHDASNDSPSWWSIRLEISYWDVVWEDHKLGRQRWQASQVSPPHGAFRNLSPAPARSTMTPWPVRHGWTALTCLVRLGKSSRTPSKESVRHSWVWAHLEWQQVR